MDIGGVGGVVVVVVGDMGVDGVVLGSVGVDNESFCSFCHGKLLCRTSYFSQGQCLTR